MHSCVCTRFTDYNMFFFFIYSDCYGCDPAILLVGVQCAHWCTGHRAAGPHSVPHRHQAG